MMHKQSAEQTDNRPEQAAHGQSIRYLPLGDSYTIGQSVPEAQRWPNQLAGRLRQDGVALQIVANPAVTGYTTQDLIDQELPLVQKLQPELVSVLIGVNDYVQGINQETFAAQLETILSRLERELPNPKAILLITIPDFGKTPVGAQFGSPAESEAGIRAFNETIKQAATRHKLPVADIFPASQAAGTDSSLIASDGLHPSGKQYGLWTDVIHQTLRDSGLVGQLQR